jgi:hypothetical protein
VFFYLIAPTPTVELSSSLPFYTGEPAALTCVAKHSPIVLLDDEETAVIIFTWFLHGNRLSSGNRYMTTQDGSSMISSLSISSLMITDSNFSCSAVNQQPSPITNETLTSEPSFDFVDIRVDSKWTLKSVSHVHSTKRDKCSGERDSSMSLRNTPIRSSPNHLH